VTGWLVSHAKSRLVCRAASWLFTTVPPVRRALTASAAPHALLRLTRFVRREPATTEATAAFASKLGLAGLARWAHERLLDRGWNPDVAARFLETVRRLEDADSYLRLAAGVRQGAERAAPHPGLLLELAVARHAEGEPVRAAAEADRALTMDPDLAAARDFVAWMTPCGELEAGVDGGIGVLSCAPDGSSSHSAAARLIESLWSGGRLPPGADEPSRPRLVAISRLCSHDGCAAARGGVRWVVVDGAVFRDALGFRRSWRLPASARPVFVSLQVHRIDDLSTDDRDVLSRFGPVGCRDWRSVYLLLNLGLEAYHAGDPASDTNPDQPARELMRAVIGLAADAASRGIAAGDLAERHRALCASAVAEARDRLTCGTSLEADSSGLCTLPIGLNARPRRGVIDIATSFDARLLPAVPAMLHSLVSSTTTGIRIFCCVRGVPARVRRRLAGRFPEIEWRFLEMDGVDYGGTFEFFGQLTMSTMDRLALPLLLPDITRLVYLDTDLIVLDDVADLWDCRTGAIGLAARPLVHPSWSPLQRLSELIAARAVDTAAADAVRRELAARVDLGASAFNGGVVVMDLDRLRAQQFSAATLHLSRRLGLHDNESMALWANGRFAPIPDRWNYIPGIERQQAPAIIHWAGQLKPWRGEHVPHEADWERAARAAARR
jgi:lipopolysaccharide biosynthesis glycosyltransferase